MRNFTELVIESIVLGRMLVGRRRMIVSRCDALLSTTMIQSLAHLSTLMPRLLMMLLLLLLGASCVLRYSTPTVT